MNPSIGHRARTTRATRRRPPKALASNIAYRTYLKLEKDLLRKEGGRCIWIEGTEIKMIAPTMREVFLAACKAKSDPANTIVRKIEPSSPLKKALLSMFRISKAPTRRRPERLVRAENRDDRNGPVLPVRI